MRMTSVKYIINLYRITVQLSIAILTEKLVKTIVFVCRKGLKKKE